MILDINVHDDDDDDYIQIKMKMRMIYDDDDVMALKAIASISVLQVAEMYDCNKWSQERRLVMMM